MQLVSYVLQLLFSIIWDTPPGTYYHNDTCIQFSGGDPQHQQVAEILNQQGRRKAQFLVNTVLHYIHCSETPDIPQPSPVNTDAIEAIVRRIMEEYSEKPTPKDVGQAPEKKTVKSEEIAFDDAAELLGEDGMAAIKNTMASFRR